MGKKFKKKLVKKFQKRERKLNNFREHERALKKFRDVPMVDTIEDKDGAVS
jgi:hypothetical protein